MELPDLPAPAGQYLNQVSKCQTQADVQELTKPYKAFESKLREVYAQHPEHPAVLQNHLVPVFSSESPTATIRARDLGKESDHVKGQYLLALPDDQRKPHGSPATVKDLATFRSNFNTFCESSLVDLNWDNVVACGSSVVSALLPVPAPHNESKRSLRAYYHQTLAPASDVDLFLYGLNEEDAKEKIKQIETSVRDSILSETTTIRTKNAITIASEYPVRHVQIVLRLYNSVSEILTGFDVDCSCVAYDGSQVWISPRAAAAFITSTNTIDLTRRSPSYENRLSKYSHRGFEVHWPALDRDRVDPTIYERSFSRVLGLARLLVLEKLPHPNDRDTYLVKRRQERGRPELPWNARYRHQLPGNVKDAQPDDVAEWVEEDDVSNYHTFTLPYGPKYNAKKIERLLFTKDLLLNAEWNRPKDRETRLHRHPAFFGRVEDVLEDCCGFCPEPETDQDLAAVEEETKIYISGKVDFLKDDPGRQTIGSFHPVSDDDWTEMAYVGNTARLCQAIINNDLEGVIDWFENGEVEQVDPNRRDHAGRTPLQLATMCSTPEIVQALIDRGARIVSRIYNGMTALHIAAYRGEVEMVKALLDKSAANEEKEDEKEESRKEARRAAGGSLTAADQDPSAESANSEWDDEDIEDTGEEDDDGSDDLTEGSFVKVSDREKDLMIDDDEDEPDVFDIDVLAWDNPLSPLHLAIIAGRNNVVETLIKDYGADVLLPVKILSSYDRTPESAILTLILALELPLTEARSAIDKLLSLGAMPTQADMKQVSALHYAVNAASTIILDTLKQSSDPKVLSKTINFLATEKGSRYGWYNKTVDSPLLTAIRTRRSDCVNAVLAMGAEPEISLEAYSAVYHREDPQASPDVDAVKKVYLENVDQPVIVAAKMELPGVVSRLVELGASVNSCPKNAYQFMRGYTWNQENKSLLDIVRDRIKDLRESLQEEAPEKLEAPQELNSNDEFLTYDEGTYQHWFAVHDLAHAKYVKNYQLSEYDAEKKKPEPKPVEGRREKRHAVETVISQYEDLELVLRKKGAKSFQDLFPDAPKSDHNSYGHVYNKDNSKLTNEPYRVEFAFYHPTVTDKNRDSYIQLFEASWRGNISIVKDLCLRKESPLQVAVQDRAGFSPFSIAVVKGHEELASTILEIATVQYHPTKNDPEYHYRLKGADDEEDDGSDVSSDTDGSDERMVLKQIVDDKYTVDDITALSETVKSKVSPLQMIGWSAELWRADGGDPKEKKCVGRPTAYHFWSHKKSSWAWFNEALAMTRRSCQQSLLEHAITKNNMPLLRFIIRTGMNLMERKAQDDDSKIYQIGANEFEHALRLGRTEATGEIIRLTGAAVPLQKMVQASGAGVPEEAPKYYQGLTVYGKKRKDWAERDAPRTEKAKENDYAPLLRAIMIGNLKSVEYFLSDAPLHRYQDFAKLFCDDKRVQRLAQVEGGIDKALSTWLGTRSDLALHMAVMSPARKDGLTPLLDYILRVMPETLDVKTKSEGKTSLQLAFELGKLSTAKALIDAGANQATRDHTGGNIMHTVLSQSWLAQPILLSQIFKLLDSNLVQSLLLERCSSPVPGSLTPLALYLQNNSNLDVLKLLFEQSRGKDLEILNGAGDYVIHSVIRKKEEGLVKFLIDYRPEMLYWENATGMTPVEVAETQYLRGIIENPVRLIRKVEYSVKNENDSHFAATKTAKSEKQKEIDEILDFGAEEFHESRTSEWRMNRLLKKLTEKYPGKRKLVSVLEANEVAKRLAGEQQKNNAETRRRERMGLNAGRRHYNYGGSEDGYDRYGRPKPKKDEDEVCMWKNEGSENAKWDLALWEARIKREKGEKVDEDEIKRHYGLQEGKIGIETATEDT